VKESTSLGAAVYAGLGGGLFDRLDEVVARVVRFEREYEPDEERHALYRSHYERWRHVYDRMLELTDAVGLRPLWRAAGT
jgi:autoinducer 2 (AI-2) kinase